MQLQSLSRQVTGFYEGLQHFFNIADDFFRQVHPQLNDDFYRPEPDETTEALTEEQQLQLTGVFQLQVLAFVTYDDPNPSNIQILSGTITMLTTGMESVAAPELEPIEPRETWTASFWKATQSFVEAMEPQLRDGFFNEDEEQQGLHLD